MEGQTGQARGGIGGAHGGLTPEQFVWWLRGFLEAKMGLQASDSDLLTVRDMVSRVGSLPHPPLIYAPNQPARAYDDLFPAPAKQPGCNCGGARG